MDLQRDSGTQQDRGHNSVHQEDNFPYNVAAKVPFGNTWAGVIDNPEGLREIYERGERDTASAIMCFVREGPKRSADMGWDFLLPSKQPRGSTNGGPSTAAPADGAN